MLRPGRDACPRNRTVRIIAEFAPEAKSLALHASYKLRGKFHGICERMRVIAAKAGEPGGNGA